MASIVMAGLMLKEKKHAAAIYGVMLGMIVASRTIRNHLQSEASL
jgi:hypothetical protein